jgi:hypothetical protein
VSAKRWTDEELLDVVRRCAADEGEPLGIAAYIGWRRRQGFVTPSEGTIGARFGGWPGAVNRAGLSSPRTGPKHPVSPKPRRNRRFGAVAPTDR